MMGKRTSRGLLAASTFALLTGCGWFGGDAPVGKARPGADRQIAPTGTLPSATPGRQSEQGVTPVDETRGTTPTVGSIVSGKGGQRAQKEAADKAAADRDAKAREQREAPAAAPATQEPAPAAPKS
jgi:hypothetical protein